MEEPKVCVLLPVYNSEDAIAEVLESIFAQTYQDFKVLVVDDASTDNTPAILKKYKSPKLEILRFKEKIGIVNALNWSLSEITEPYIIRADVHLLSVKDRFQKLVSFMDENPEIGVCGSLLADDNSHLTSFYQNIGAVIPHEIVAAKMLVHNPLKRGSMIIRSSVLQQKGFRLSDKYKQMEDYDLWYRMRNETRFAVLNEPLVKYRSKNFSWDDNFYEQFKSEALSFYLDKLLEFGIKPSVRELKIHLDLSDISRIGKLSNPIAYKEWIEKLIQQNQKVNSFPSEALKDFLDYKWRKLFKVVLTKKNKRIMEYLQADGKGKLQIFFFILKFRFKQLFS